MYSFLLKGIRVKETFFFCLPFPKFSVSCLASKANKQFLKKDWSCPRRPRWIYVIVIRMEHLNFNIDTKKGCCWFYKHTHYEWLYSCFGLRMLLVERLSPKLLSRSNLIKNYQKNFKYWFNLNNPQIFGSSSPQLCFKNQDQIARVVTACQMNQKKYLFASVPCAICFVCFFPEWLS